MTKHQRLDDTTADRLLAGVVAPDDTPPGFVAASGLINEARADLGPSPAIDESLVAAMVQAIQTSPQPIAHRRNPVLAKILTVKAAALFGVLALSATGAAAASGSLPAAAQDGLSKAASHVGVDLPRSDKAGDNGKGAVVSDKAKSDDTTGVDKGADVSGTASDGKSRAGDDHPTADANPSTGDHTSGTPAVSTPNSGGTGTASDASNGASDAGTVHAPAQASDGSANAGDHPDADSHPDSTNHPSGRP
ncbi:MAG TPA: hypothetical protein VFB78_17185 [Acidimicrobiales bacterium]|nr:hypothetical protein [Acidimicrobiales bacterium]